MKGTGRPPGAPPPLQRHGSGNEFKERGHAALLGVGFAASLNESSRSGPDGGLILQSRIGVALFDSEAQAIPSAPFIEDYGRRGQRCRHGFPFPTFPREMRARADPDSAGKAWLWRALSSQPSPRVARARGHSTPRGSGRNVKMTGDRPDRLTRRCAQSGAQQENSRSAGGRAPAPTAQAARQLRRGSGYARAPRHVIRPLSCWIDSTAAISLICVWRMAAITPIVLSG